MPDYTVYNLCIDLHFKTWSVLQDNGRVWLAGDFPYLKLRLLLAGDEPEVELTAPSELLPTVPSGGKTINQSVTLESMGAEHFPKAQK